MKEITVCGKCKSEDIEYLGHDRCFCRKCQKETDSKDIYVQSPQERLRAYVYSTGNRWAIENYNATHN